MRCQALDYFLGLSHKTLEAAHRLTEGLLGALKWYKHQDMAAVSAWVCEAKLGVEGLAQ